MFSASMRHMLMKIRFHATKLGPYTYRLMAVDTLQWTENSFMEKSEQK